MAGFMSDIDYALHIYRGCAADYLHFSCVEALKRHVRVGPGTTGR